jgi:hypothetical protein
MIIVPSILPSFLMDARRSTLDKFVQESSFFLYNATRLMLDAKT